MLATAPLAKRPLPFLSSPFTREHVPHLHHTTNAAPKSATAATAATKPDTLTPTGAAPAAVVGLASLLAPPLVPEPDPSAAPPEEEEEDTSASFMRTVPPTLDEFVQASVERSVAVSEKVMSAHYLEVRTHMCLIPNRLFFFTSFFSG